MSNGIISWNAFSTLKYTGSTITNKFYTTLANQELILFLDKDGKQQLCNSVTVMADTSDIYFTPVRNIENPSAYVFTNEPVLVCLAGESVTISGVPLKGVKLSNALGAKILVMGTTY